MKRNIVSLFNHNRLMKRKTHQIDSHYVTVNIKLINQRYRNKFYLLLFIIRTDSELIFIYD